LKRDSDCFFIHVPKTGGNYVGATLNGIKYTANHYIYYDCLSSTLNDYPPIGKYFNNLFNFAKGDISEVKKYNQICFATVRNPYDWFVSYYHVTPQCFDVVSFDYFIESVADSNDGWPCRKFIFFPFFSYEGDFLVDYLLRQGRLNKDLEEFADKFDKITYSRKNRIKVSKKRKYKDYRSYYTDKLVDIVEKTWWRELGLYGYTFDGRVPGFLNKEVDMKDKYNIKYFWNSDKLFLKGEEIK